MTIDQQPIFDRLQQIFREQQIFTDRVYKPFNDLPFQCYNFDKETFDLFYTLVRAQIELSEAMSEIDKHTKIWKNDKGGPYDKQKVLTELIDTAKFIHQAILFLGYTDDDYYLQHTKKNEKNHKRQNDGY